MNSCTLTDATARLAYGDEYDGRYNGPAGGSWTEAAARALRRRNILYPSNSGLPGASVLIAQTNPAAFSQALAVWKETDCRKWHEAQRVLLSELAAGNILAFNEEGYAAPPEFWLVDNLSSRRACRFLLHASCVDRLLRQRARNARQEFEARREKLIRNFSDKQRWLRNWISFADMADWCAREDGSIQPDARLRTDAYRQLGEAITRGEFQGNSLTRVLFLNPTVQWFKMTRERFEACPFDIRDDQRGVSDLKVTYLECCWIPRAMSAQWFAVRRMQPPPWVTGHERRESDQPLPVLLQRANLRSQQPLGGDDPTGSTQDNHSDPPAGETHHHRILIAEPPSPDDLGSRQRKPPVATAELQRWYEARRDGWPAHRKHPSEAEDLTDAKRRFLEHHVTREAVRTVRARLAPQAWTAFGRRKRARE